MIRRPGRGARPGLYRPVLSVNVRVTEFRALMSEYFGNRARSVAKDHVFGALGDRTADQAIDAGLPAREVWFAVCDAFDVPSTLRWGLPD